MLFLSLVSLSKKHRRSLNWFTFVWAPQILPEKESGTQRLLGKKEMRL